jgi:hypothetical protein
MAAAATVANGLGLATHCNIQSFQSIAAVILQSSDFSFIPPPLHLTFRRINLFPPPSPVLLSLFPPPPPAIALRIDRRSSHHYDIAHSTNQTDRQTYTSSQTSIWEEGSLSVWQLLSGCALSQQLEPSFFVCRSRPELGGQIV